MSSERCTNPHISSQRGDPGVRILHQEREHLKLIRDDMGHLGRDRTSALAHDRLFWLGMTTHN